MRKEEQDANRNIFHTLEYWKEEKEKMKLGFNQQHTVCQLSKK